MSPEDQAKVVRMRAHLKRSELYANYWIAQATTGAATSRNLSRGVEGGGWRQLTDEEKIQSALDTALNHIHSIEETANNLASLIENSGGEL